LLQDELALGLGWLQGNLDDADEVESTSNYKDKDPLPVLRVGLHSDIDET
jgi:hypothetical protein